MTRPLSLFALLIPTLAALALACTPDGNGGDGGGGSGGDTDGGVVGDLPGDPLDAEELGETIAAFTCDIIDRCDALGDEFAFFQLFTDAGGDCERYFARNFARQYGDPAYAEVRVDNAALVRCRDAALAACEIGDVVPDCEDALRGRRDIGEPCPQDIVCAPGLYCADDPTAEGECRSACAPRKALGEPCDYTSQCAATAQQRVACVYSGSDGACTAYTMRDDVAEGQPCGFIGGDAGFERVSCAAGLYCDVSYDPELDEGPGQCRARAAVGQPCSNEGRACDGGICVGGQCTAVQVVNAPGAACDVRQLQVCNPLADVICVDAVCRATTGAEGDPCEGDLLGAPCGAGLYCTDGVCAPQLAEGEGCDPDGDFDACAGGYCRVDPDNGGQGTCVVDVDACL